MLENISSLKSKDSVNNWGSIKDSPVLLFSISGAARSTPPHPTLHSTQTLSVPYFTNKHTHTSFHLSKRTANPSCSVWPTHGTWAAGVEQGALFNTAELYMTTLLKTGSVNQTCWGHEGGVASGQLSGTLTGDKTHFRQGLRTPPGGVVYREREEREREMQCVPVCLEQDVVLWQEAAVTG